VLSAARAYYRHLATKAILAAQKVDLRDAELNLEAAEARHKAGVATIADVLQAKTAAARARLVVHATEGEILATRGILATAMGLPANFAYEVEELPDDYPVEEVQREADELIREALARRPDLAAARARALADEAQIRRVESEGLPALNLSAGASGTWFEVRHGGVDRREDAYTAGLLLRWPLFTGFSQSYNERRARAEAEASRERSRSTEQDVVLQVFNSYYVLRTAGQRIRTAEELVASAEQSEKVAEGRYREGVGTILDLVSAQTALADARSQRVQARWDWRLGLAQLAHDTGLLGLRGEALLTPDEANR
jgi:outer membrane protein TolC